MSLRTKQKETEGEKDIHRQGVTSEPEVNYYIYVRFY